MTQKIASDKVAIYIRWSTEDQGQGHTLEIQRESCRYYCLSQGWVPRDDLTFIDEGYSGGNLERPALSRLRAKVKAGLVDCVVVYKLDRLSRNIKDIINLVLDEWEDACSVRSTQEPVDTTSDAGKMFFTMLGSFADFERSTIKTRTWSGKRKNAEKGRNPGMVYPFGFCKGENGEWALVEQEAATVRRMFSEYLRGRSCTHIAHDLNAQGLYTRSGKMWQNADISRLLRNPLYAGRLMYNRRSWAQLKKLGRIIDKDAAEVIACEGAAPAIIDPETWEQVQGVRAKRPRIGRGTSARTQSSRYLLAGLVKCKCGHAWTGMQNDRFQFYKCAGAKAAGDAKCASRAIKMETLDAFVVDRVKATWPLKGAFRAELFSGLAERLKEHDARARTLQQRLDGLERTLERFKGDYKAGKLSADVYMDLIRESRAEREQAESQLARADEERRALAASQVDLGQAAAWFARLDAWDTLALTEQQQILRMLVSRVVVSRPKGTTEVEVHIAWRLPAGCTGDM